MATDMVSNVIEKDMGWQRIKLDFEQLKGRGVKVGLMGSVDYEGTSVIDYAYWNEFGTRHIPARPFMATTADRYRDGVYAYTERLIGGLIDGKYRVNNVLTYIGMWYQSKVRITIRQAKQWAVPDAPATIKAKGSSSPLIDTGRMVNAVNYEIISGNGLRITRETES
jgi:hypothetical protein